MLRESQCYRRGSSLFEIGWRVRCERLSRNNFLTSQCEFRLPSLSGEQVVRWGPFLWKSD